MHVKDGDISPESDYLRIADKFGSGDLFLLSQFVAIQMLTNYYLL
jgi:hypothetical protein